MELCEWLDITILEGAICSDHGHMCLSVPPKYSPSHVMKILKGKSAERLRDEYPELRKRYWGLHIWERGYFVSTVGINSTVIQNYVKEQAEEQIREDQLRLWKDDSK
jgi:putative transposase